MTLDQLLNKWGYNFSFTVMTINTGNYQYQYDVARVDLSKIELFTKDVEDYFNSAINANIIAEPTDRNLYPLKFKASVEEPLNYKIGDELSEILKNVLSTGSLFSPNVDIEQLFENEKIWKEYVSVKREFEMLEGDDKEISAISIEPKQSKFIGRRSLNYSYVYNQTTNVNDYKINLQTNILLNSIKGYLKGQSITALGVLKKKGETTVETIETPKIGNWKTVIEEDGTSTFIELKKDEVIQEMKDLMDPQIGKEYHSYSIQEVGNNIRVETTPFDKEPFDVKIENIKLEE